MLAGRDNNPKEAAVPQDPRSLTARKNYKMQCMECDQSFGQKEHLKRHILTVHRGEKPFKCTECDKSFGYNHILKTHVQTVHLKLKPYKCQHCGMDFGEKSNMTKHIKSVHSEKE